TPKNTAMLRIGPLKNCISRAYRVSRPWRSIVIQDLADAAILGEQHIVAEAEPVGVEVLVDLGLAGALDLDVEGLRRLARPIGSACSRRGAEKNRSDPLCRLSRGRCGPDRQGSPARAPH